MEYQVLFITHVRTKIYGIKCLHSEQMASSQANSTLDISLSSRKICILCACIGMMISTNIQDILIMFHYQLMVINHTNTWSI